MASADDTDIARLWRDLDALLATAAPRIHRTLRGPARPAELEWLEAHGAHPSVIASYRHHDGADYRRVARGGGLMARLPSTVLRWCGATRFIPLAELVEEHARHGPRVGLAPGWVVVGKLYEPRRWQPSVHEDDCIVVVDADGNLHGAVVLVGPGCGPDPPAVVTPLGLGWAGYLAQLRSELQAGYREQLDAGIGTFLRLVPSVVVPAPPRRSPGEMLVSLLGEAGKVELSGSPSRGLVEAIERALRKRKPQARAAAVLAALDAAPEVDEVFCTEAELEQLLEGF